MIRAIAITLGLMLAAACGDLPEMDTTLGPPPAGTDYPSLLPIAELRAIDAGIPEGTQDENEALEARASGLRARAAGLAAE